MTKRHFEAIARVINSVGDSNRGNADILLQLAQGIAEVCQETNPNFDRARFIAACFTYQKGEVA